MHGVRPAVLPHDEKYEEAGEVGAAEVLPHVPIPYGA
jgi:hypothetical protein